MLQSKQNVHFGYPFHFHLPDTVNQLVKRGLSDVLYLLLPEDTTDRQQKDLAPPANCNIRSTVKAVFWLAVSITLSLALGQLQ